MSLLWNILCSNLTGLDVPFSKKHSREWSSTSLSFQVSFRAETIALAFLERLKSGSQRNIISKRVFIKVGITTFSTTLNAESLEGLSPKGSGKKIDFFEHTQENLNDFVMKNRILAIFEFFLCQPALLVQYGKLFKVDNFKFRNLGEFISSGWIAWFKKISPTQTKEAQDIRTSISYFKKVLKGVIREEMVMFLLLVLQRCGLSCKREMEKLKLINQAGFFQGEILPGAKNVMYAYSLSNGGYGTVGNYHQTISFITTKLVPSTLESEITDPINAGSRALGPERACRLGRDIVSGMVFLHDSVGIFHNDLKVDNILIDPATDKLTIVDFGFGTDNVTTEWAYEGLIRQRYGVVDHSTVKKFQRVFDITRACCVYLRLRYGVFPQGLYDPRQCLDRQQTTYTSLPKGLDDQFAESELAAFINSIIKKENVKMTQLLHILDRECLKTPWKPEQVNMKIDMLLRNEETLHQRVEGMGRRMDSLEQKNHSLEQKNDEMGRRIDSLEQKNDNFQEKLESMVNEDKSYVEDVKTECSKVEYNDSMLKTRIDNLSNQHAKKVQRIIKKKPKNLGSGMNMVFPMTQKPMPTPMPPTGPTERMEFVMEDKEEEEEKVTGQKRKRNEEDDKSEGKGTKMRKME